MKTALFTNKTGSIQPNAGVNTVTVADWDTPIGIVITTNRQDDRVMLVRQNTAATGWEPVTDGEGIVYLSAKRLDVTLTMPDVYGLQGYVKGVMSAVKVA